MNIILYFILFIMGTVFGSFLTLATYRIPLNQDITHKHSYCPNCNHLLSFWDMIPILSYIFLKGKCRYCKVKISPRYFIIEILSGIAFILLGLITNINIYNLTTIKIEELGIGILYIVFIFLIAQIDKEHNYIDDRVLIYGLVISIIDIIFKYQIESENNQGRLILYLIIIALLLIFSIYKSKSKKFNNYYVNIIIFCIINNLFIYEIPTILVIIYTLLILAIKNLINKILNKEKKNDKKLPIAFYMCIANTLTLIMIFIKMGGI